MPRYFFNLYNDETSTDEEGKECADLEAAAAHGMSETRDMVGVSARKGHIASATASTSPMKSELF